MIVRAVKIIFELVIFNMNLNWTDMVNAKPFFRRPFGKKKTYSVVIFNFLYFLWIDIWSPICKYFFYGNSILVEKEYFVILSARLVVPVSKLLRQWRH